MADEVKKSKTELLAEDEALLRNKLLQMQIETAGVQMETAQIALEQQRETNEDYKQRKAIRARQNAKRQAQMVRDAKVMLALQKTCRHKQGGRHENVQKGDGKSVLTRSLIFFAGNFLIQCNRCGLSVQRPNPLLKKLNRKLYEAAMDEYNRLLEMSESNGLEPMLSPTFEFRNNDGDAIHPLDPGMRGTEDVPLLQLLGLK